MMSLKGGERSGQFTAKNSHQRWKVNLLTMAVAGAGLSSMIANSYGAILTKANNTTPLSQAASWVPAQAPTSADTLVFDNTVQAANTAQTLGAAVNVTGLQLLDPAGAISITDTNALTLGAGGIDMSLASQNLSLALPVVLSAAQEWHVAQGTTLTASGTIDTTGGSLTVRGAGNTTLSGVISGANGVTKYGAGTLTLSNAETYTGATTIGGGTLQVTGSINSASALVMNGGTLKLNGTSQTFASTTFNQGFSTLDAGGGTISLNAVTRATGASVRFMPGSTYTPAFGTNISSGTTGSTYYATWGLTDAATVDSDSGNIVGGDSISGFWLVGTTSSGAQRFNGPGQNRLDVGSVSGLFRSNTENPTIDILRFNSPQGGYQVGRDGNNGPVFVVRNTNVVSFNEILVTPNVGAEDVFITDDTTINNTGPRANGDLTLWQNNTQGFLVFNVGITSTGAGTVTKDGAGTVLMNGTNNYAGNTIVGEGTLEIGNLRGLSSNTNSNLVMDGGNVLSLINLQYTSDGTFSGTSKNVTLNGAGGTLAAVTGDSFAISGTISGVGGINIGMGATDATSRPGQTLVTHTTVNGNGTVIFAGANTYTGLTDVKSGTLQVSNTTGSGTGTGNVAVESSGILGGSGSIAGNVLVKTGGFIAPGDGVSLDPNSGAANIGTLTVTGKVTFSSGAVLNYEPGDLLKAASFAFADSTAKMNVYTPGATTPFFGGGVFTVLTAGSSAAINAVAGKFSTASILNPAGANTYAFSVSGNSLLLTIVSPAITSAWIGTDQSWNLTEQTNWTAVQTSPLRPGDRIPHNQYDTANFAGAGSTTVKVDGAISVGFMNLSGASYNITNGSGALTLDAAGVNAQINDLGGAQTISANFTAAGGLQLNVNNSSDTLTISGNISGGSNTLTKIGPGTAVLTGTNTLGATIISSGTLQVGNGGTTGNIGATGSITDSGILKFNRSDNITIANAISGSGSVVQAGVGTLVLNGTNTYSGGTTISSGVVQMGNTGALGTGLVNIVGSSQVDVNGLAATFGGITGTGVITNLAAGNTTITINSGANRTFDGRVAETSGKGLLALVKSGGGELNMTNLNSYTGGTFITAGSIVLNPQGQASGTSIPTAITTSGSGQVHVINGLVANNVINMSGGAVDAVNFDTQTSAAASATLTGAITATGTTVYQMGVASDFGTLTLTGTNTGTANVANLSEGDIIFSGTGKLQLLTSGATTGGAIRIGTGSNAFVSVINGASMSTTAASGDGLILGTGGAGDPNFSLPQTLNITGGTVDIGTSTLNMQGSTFNTFVSGYANSVLNLNTGGVLKLASVRQQIGSDSQQARFFFNGGTLVATASGRIFDTSTGNTLLRVLAGGAFISVDNTTVVAATLGHALDNGGGTDGGLTKLGQGTLTLAQDDSYNGGTTVAAGDLVLGSGSFSPLGSGNAPLTVASGARLDINNQSLNQITSLSGGGTIQQNSTGTITLTFGNNNASGNFSGGVANGSGKINLVKTGTGTQTFSGNNVYGSLTISSGAVVAGASGTLDNGTIIVSSNNGLQIADGVAVAGNVFTNVTGEFEDVPTGNGTISGPVTVQSGSYVAGISGTGSLTLSNTQNLSGGTTATIDRGNVILASLAQFQASNATLTVGSPTFTTADSFTVRDSANLSVANIVLGGAAAQAISFNELGGSVNTNSGTFNLLSGGASGSTINLAGGNLTTMAFTKTSSAASTLNWNGGTITAGGSSATFLPALAGLSVNLGTGGGKFNDNGNTVTIGANLAGTAGDGGFNKAGSGTTTLTGALTYNGATNIQAGTLRFTGTQTIHAVTNTGSTGTDTLLADTGSNVTVDSMKLSNLNINGQVTVKQTATPNTATSTSVVGKLNIAGASNAWTGKLDLGDNSLVISAPTTGGGAAAQTQARTVANQIKQGLNINGTLFAGNGITSSKAQTLDASNPVFAVGMIQNNDATVGVGDGTTSAAGNAIYTSFEGKTVALNDTLVKYTYFGDADLSGKIDPTDFFLINNGFANHLSGWINGDFDGNGVIDSTDYFLLDNAFAAQSGTLASQFVLAQPFGAENLSGLEAIGDVKVAAPVPEPASLGILGAAGVALLIRRRRPR